MRKPFPSLHFLCLFGFQLLNFSRAQEAASNSSTTSTNEVSKPSETIVNPSPAPGSVQAPTTPADAGSPNSDANSIINLITNFDPALWNLDPDGFIDSNKKLGFDWQKYEQKKLARSYKDLSFLDFNISESEVHFRKGQLQTIILYLAKGKPDEPAFDQKGFDEFFAKVGPALDKWSGFKDVDAWVKPLKGFSKRKSWFKYPLRIDLDWGSRQDPNEIKNRNIGIEFVRLQITPYDGKTSIVALTNEAFQKKDQKATALKDLTANIQRDPNGDVYIRNVPMVEMADDNDYSVTSTADRLLRYYELSMDQEELRNMAILGVREDNSPDEMYRTLKKLADRFGLSSKELQGTDLQALIEQTKRYNILGKTNKLVHVSLPKKTTKLNDWFGNFNGLGVFLKQIRNSDKTDVARFERQVEDVIEKGAPVCWLVYLGWSDEKNPEGAMKPKGKRNPHMRLIVGYNKLTKEILYSDPWGEGHELKRMPLEDAFMLTNGLYSVLPSS